MTQMEMTFTKNGENHTVVGDITVPDPVNSPTVFQLYNGRFTCGYDHDSAGNHV